MTAASAGASPASDREVAIERAAAALVAADPVLGAIIESVGPLDRARRRRGRSEDAYGVLLRAIVGQQLSTKAAKTIFERMIAPYEGRMPLPAEILAAPEEDLRAAGLSFQKIGYLRDLAERIESGLLDLDVLATVSDDEVIEQLTAVRGIGRWTAEMFLIFHLERPDTMPVGDLGIRRAAMLAYGLDEMPAPDRLFEIAEPWRPHRSLAALYLWESLDAVPAGDVAVDAAG